MAIKNNNRQYQIALAPFLFAFLILLPRLISPQFGFFDDASTLSQSQSFLQGDFSMEKDMEAGRFRPVYWLYYTLIYAFAGYHSFWYYLGNLVLLFALLIEIRLLIKQSGGVEWQIQLASFLFLFSMPIVENFYTLSKGEPLQMILLLGAILLLDPKPSDRPGKLRGKSLLAGLLLLLAIMVKETAIIMVPLTVLWALYPTLSKANSLKANRPYYWRLAAGASLSVAGFFISRRVVQATSLLGGSYTNKYMINLGEMLERVLRWITQYTFYFLFTVPIILLLIWFIIKKVRVDEDLKFKLFRWGTWCVLWFAIYLPWEFAKTYYLLPFALGVAMVVGLSAPIVIKQIKEFNLFSRVVTVVLAVLSGVLFLLTIPSYITNARVQLAFDKANDQMLRYVVNDTPANAVILLNIETYKEYTEKIEEYLFTHYNREDIVFLNIDQALMETVDERNQAYVLVPIIDNQPELTVRAGVIETYQDVWDQKFFDKTTNHRDFLVSFEESFRLSNINLPVVLCQFGLEAGFCQTPDILIDTRPFSYRWEIYQIQ